MLEPLVDGLEKKRPADELTDLKMAGCSVADDACYRADKKIQKKMKNCHFFCPEDPLWRLVLYLGVMILAVF